MIFRHIFVLSILMASACKSQKTNSEMESKNDQLELLVEDAYFPVDERQAMVIEDEKSLRAFFSKVNRTRKPGLAVPEIDFDNEVALVVCSGEQKGNAMPYLEKEKASEQLLNITIKNKSLGKNQKTEKNAVTYPLAVYKMDKTRKKIDFIWE